MSDEFYPKDENLRLILSTDQEEWLSQRIREYKIILWVMSVILAGSVAWATASLTGMVAPTEEAECFSFAGDAPDHEKLRQQFLAEGMKPCPTEPPKVTGDFAMDWSDTHSVATLVSVVAAMVSFLILLRNLFLLRQYKGYLVDHRAFLKKYNRL